MNEDSLFHILAVLFFLTVSSISIYHRRKADQAGAEKITLEAEKPVLRVTLRLFGLAMWLGVFAYLIYPPWMDWSRIDLPAWVRWIGVGMGFCAIPLAWWVFRSLAHNVTPTVVTRSNASLVTHGPYRWVRHPLYTTGMLAYLGVALLAENWYIAAAAVVGFIPLLLRTSDEEARLIEKFGESYRSYMQRTGRFLPKLG